MSKLFNMAQSYRLLHPLEGLQSLRVLYVPCSTEGNFASDAKDINKQYLILLQYTLLYSA